MKHIVATCISQRTLQRPMWIESLRGTKWRWNLNSHFVVSVVLRTCTTASQLLNEAAKTHVSVIPLQTKANLKPWQLFLLLLEIWHVKRHCLGCWNIEILIWGYQISKTTGGQGFNETPNESPNQSTQKGGLKFSNILLLYCLYSDRYCCFARLLVVQFTSAAVRIHLLSSLCISHPSIEGM